MTAFDAKLRLLHSLRDGWDGEGSLAINKIAFENYDRFLEAVTDLDDRAEPIATTDGGIRMEWANLNGEYVAEISPAGGLYLLFVPYSGLDREQEFKEFVADNLVEFYETGRRR